MGAWWALLLLLPQQPEGGRRVGGRPPLLLLLLLLLSAAPRCGHASQAVGKAQHVSAGFPTHAVAALPWAPLPRANPTTTPPPTPARCASRRPALASAPLAPAHADGSFLMRFSCSSTCSALLRSSHSARDLADCVWSAVRVVREAEESERG